ncbi:glycosyltransferase family 4 protein [Phycisphaerales bacterium AB-hyl4]|uniref:Glycosyltransferase family 4 protein n=1 Tax=Natronomicrosphaera hydrolytica TaxID=3242702 RepID=A0ABV4U8N0_9BACT
MPPNTTTTAAPLRIALVLPGLHRVRRGAETAFEAVGRELANLPDFNVTLIGSGPPRPDEPYRYRRVPCITRERFHHYPNLPMLRSEYCYEELSFTPGLFHAYRPRDYDLTMTCSYPYTNWLLRRPARRRPAHIYVTQNGDWPAQEFRREYRFFHCDGLVCTNPDYYYRNRDLWPATLIPNGVDPRTFAPGKADRAAFGLPVDQPVALMVSAMIRTKRVLEGVQAVSRVPNLHLAIAGDGPERGEIERFACLNHMCNRLHLFDLPRERMPDLYRCADVFLHMSQTEPSANAYIEALATGLPIVTHDRDVTRWTLESQAHYVDTNDLAEVARALQHATEKHAPRAAAARRALAERRFTWPAIARAYADFFHEVHQNHTHPT